MACSNKSCSGGGVCHSHRRARVNPEYCSYGTYNCGSCASSGYNGRSSCGCGNCGCSSCSHGGCPSCSSRQNGCYGVLRGIAGPYHRPGPWPPNPCFPFYTGPCGPCERDLCDTCGDCSCGHHCSDPCCEDACDACNTCDSCSHCNVCDSCSSATFTASAPVQLPSGGCVNLGCNTPVDDFSVSPEGIRIHRAGRYMVIYTVHVPANETVNSRFVLSMDGERMHASAADVTSLADGSTNGYSMHAMVHAREGSLLQLISLGPVSMCASACSNVFTLSIYRIC